MQHFFFLQKHTKKPHKGKTAFFVIIFHNVFELFCVHEWPLTEEKKCHTQTRPQILTLERKDCWHTAVHAEEKTFCLSLKIRLISNLCSVDIVPWSHFVCLISFSVSKKSCDQTHEETDVKTSSGKSQGKRKYDYLYKYILMYIYCLNQYNLYSGVINGGNDLNLRYNNWLYQNTWQQSNWKMSCLHCRICTGKQSKSVVLIFRKNL